MSQEGICDYLNQDDKITVISNLNTKNNKRLHEEETAHEQPKWNAVTQASTQGLGYTWKVEGIVY